MTLYVLCGIPGSGKTTTSKRIASECNAKVYHYDEFKKDFIGSDIKRTHKRLYECIVSDILLGNDVVLDDLHTKLICRKDLLSAIQDAPCKKVLIVMTTPFDECIIRNSQRQGKARLPEFVIINLNASYQPPTIDEGWDEIQYI